MNPPAEDTVRRRTVLASAGFAFVAAAVSTSEPVEAAPAAPDPTMSLWYDEPATDWESQALPIGNGALGAMHFGGLTSDRIQFNEKTLWTGGPGSPGWNGGNWPTVIPMPSRRLSGRSTSGSWCRPRNSPRIGATPRVAYGSYATFGDLALTFPGAPRDGPGLPA